MMPPADRLTVVILTFNEERHIARAIASIADLAATILVVDSGSTDQTREIAIGHGATVLQHPWTTHADQFNWAIDQLPGGSGWIMRLDADEIVSSELRIAIKQALASVPPSIMGMVLLRRIWFLGKPIRHGGATPNHVLRLFRQHHGRCEQRWMDEHIIIDGATTTLRGELADNNLNGLGWWTDKHNRYASLEVIDILNARHRFLPHRGIAQSTSGGPARSKRWIKENIYNRLPSGFRASLYFLYRYVFRLGFLDGKEGFFFHVLQGFWYRLLVDAKLHEVRQHMRGTGCDAPEAIATILGIDVRNSERSLVNE